MLSVKRILKLAEKYGPFIRFYPEGSEGEDDALDDAAKADGEAGAKDKDGFDKERQQADQAAANAVKATNVYIKEQQRANEAERLLQETKTENENLKNQLEEAEKKASEAGIDVDLKEEEFGGSDLTLVRSIKALKKGIEARDKRIDALEKKAAGYEKQDRKEKALQARNSAYEELLGELDAEYGADCRNEALKKFDALTKEGKVPKGNPAKATRIMERCYKEVKGTKDEAAKKKDPSLILDTGSGGSAAPNLSGVKLKKGSLDEVAAQAGASLKK